MNFAALKAEQPQLRPIWDKFDQWNVAHPTKRIIEPKALARYMAPVSPEELLAACRVMVRLGMLHQAFIVESKDGQLLGQPFGSPSDAPSRVPDSFEGFIDTSDAAIVPIFVVER